MAGQSLIRRAADIAWMPSPNGTVERKRYHHAGSEESGLVTSLVRYPAGARFPMHPHPEGEEILVLEGVFSDHSGDYPAGTHLLNPEGFSHAPWSEPGCLLFVKLRQYAGEDQPQQQLHTNRLPWDSQPGGLEMLVLQQDTAKGEERLMIRGQSGQTWQPGPGETEIFVVDGDWSLAQHNLHALDWASLAAGDDSPLNCLSAGTLYVMRQRSS